MDPVKTAAMTAAVIWLAVVVVLYLGRRR